MRYIYEVVSVFDLERVAWVEHAICSKKWCYSAHLQFLSTPNRQLLGRVARLDGVRLKFQEGVVRLLSHTTQSYNPLLADRWSCGSVHMFFRNVRSRDGHGKRCVAVDGPNPSLRPPVLDLASVRFSISSPNINSLQAEGTKQTVYR